MESILGPLGTSPTSGLLYLPRMIVRIEKLMAWGLAGGKTCPSATLSTTNRTWPDLGANQGRRGGNTATNRLSYGAAPLHGYLSLQSAHSHTARISGGWRHETRLACAALHTFLITDINKPIIVQNFAPGKKTQKFNAGALKMECKQSTPWETPLKRRHICSTYDHSRCFHWSIAHVQSC
jgi:hypothetical protein